MTAQFTLQTHLGAVTARFRHDRLCALQLHKNLADSYFAPYLLSGSPGPETSPPARLAASLLRYFAGQPTDFSSCDIDISHLPPFFRKVFAAARRIPYGKTWTYGQLAARAGNPKAARAVGQAMARNPVPIVIPCHRVLASGGKLGGFGGGLDLKTALLNLENTAPRGGEK